MSRDQCPFCDRRFFGPVVYIASVVHSPGYEWHKARYAHPECWTSVDGAEEVPRADFHLGLTPDAHEDEWHGGPRDGRVSVRIPIFDRLPSTGINAEDAAFESEAKPQPNHVRDAIEANR